MADDTLSETEQVGILSGRPPAEIEQWRNEDPARRTYSNNVEFAELVPDNAFDGADAPTETRQSAVKEFRAMLADTGLSPVEARQLLNRSSAVKAEGKTDEQLRKETRLALQRRYGADADAVLADARQLVRRDPRFEKFVGRKGIGNDPETVLLLAGAARSLRAKGRLK